MHIWCVCTMHFYSSVHNSVASLKTHFQTTSDQHQELGVSRLTCNYIDLNKAIHVFNSHNLFDIKRGKIQSLPTRSVAGENVNYYNAEEVGINIYKILDDTFLEWSRLERKILL